MNEKEKRELDELAIVGFSDPTPEAVFDAFKTSHEEAKRARILYACRVNEGYEGYALVLFDKDDQLWEVNGSLDSRYGLAGQWEPEKVDVKELIHRFEHSPYLLGSERAVYNAFPLEWCEFAYAFLKVIEKLKAKGYQMVSDGGEDHAKTERILAQLDGKPMNEMEVAAVIQDLADSIEDFINNLEREE